MRPQQVPIQLRVEVPVDIVALRAAQALGADPRVTRRREGRASSGGWPAGDRLRTATGTVPLTKLEFGVMKYGHRFTGFPQRPV